MRGGFHSSTKAPILLPKKIRNGTVRLKQTVPAMEKQHNRGQDGAGVATIKLDIAPGKRYISRHRSMAPSAVADIFEYIQKKFADIQKESPEKMADTEWLKEH